LISTHKTHHYKKILLNAYDIETPMTSYFEHSTAKKTNALIELLKTGKDIALVSDAGTPGISDPGYRLINAALKENISVTATPGVSACIAALTLSGMPSDRFIFEGFLPVKSVGRKKRLEFFKEEKRTIIFYESVHRIVKTLNDICEVFNDPEIACAREITKKFEDIRLAKASELVEHFTNTKPKGEFVLLLNLKRK